MTALSRGAIARVGLILILCIATWLRVQGLAFGLPAVYNPDEIAIVSRALAFAKGDLNPHNFLYPTFYFYVLFAWIGAYFAAAWAVGAVPSISAFQTQFFVDPTGIYLAGRVLGVVCGVATVWVVHLLGRRLIDERTGLVAALFLAVAPTAVRDAHYVKHDVPVTLAIVAVYLAIERLARAGLRLSAFGFRTTAEGPAAVLREPKAAGRKPATTRPRWSLLMAGAACGVAFSTHYYAVFLVVPLAVGVYVARRGDGARAVARDLVVAGTVATIVFIALSPFLLVEPRRAWQDIVANRQIVVDRAAAGHRGAFASAAAYARLLWTESVGWPVIVAAIVGLGLLTVNRPRLAALLVAFPVPFLLFIGNTVAASRYLNPVLPFIALFAAHAVVEVGSRIGSPKDWRPGETSDTPVDPKRWRGLIVAAVAVPLALPGFLLSARIGRFFEQDDTRTLAQRFIEAHIPAGSTVLVQPYSVQLVQSREGLREALTTNLGSPARASTKFALRLALEPYPSPAYRTLFLGDGGLDADKIYVSHRDVDGSAGLAPLARLGVEYVLLKRYNTEDLAVAPLRALLVAQGRLLVTFPPYRPDADARTRALVTPFLHNTDTPYDQALERPGPGVEVWGIAGAH